MGFHEKDEIMDFVVKKKNVDHLNVGGAPTKSRRQRRADLKNRRRRETNIGGATGVGL
jgi:hypothetical protein